MLVSMAILCLVVAAAPECRGLPAKGDSTGSARLSIVDMARITLVHISKLKTRLQVVAEIPVRPPSVQGLTGISRDLGRLEAELRSPFADLLGQVEADLSGLGGRVRSLAAAMNCTAQPRPTAAGGERPFPHSRLYLTLVRVQHYLEALVQDQDQLAVC